MNNTQDDLLLQYTQAFDRGDFQAMAYLVGMMGRDKGLETAINTIHRRFHCGWSFTAQLLDYRASLVKKDEVKG